MNIIDLIWSDLIRADLIKYLALIQVMSYCCGSRCKESALLTELIHILIGWGELGHCKATDRGFPKVRSDIVWSTLEIKMSFSWKLFIFLPQIDKLLGVMYSVQDSNIYLLLHKYMIYNREAHMPDVRNSKRCIWDSPEEADQIWQRIKSFIPQHFQGCNVVGLNNRLVIVPVWQFDT